MIARRAITCDHRPGLAVRPPRSQARLAVDPRDQRLELAVDPRDHRLGLAVDPRLGTAS